MTQENKIKNRQLTYPQYIDTYVQQDEISLVDLWITLLKFKRVFVKSLIVMLIVGAVVMSIVTEEKYTMNSIISIGKNFRTNQLIESPESVINRANLLLITEIAQKISENNDIGFFTTNISNPKKTRLIVIENQVTKENRKIIAQFQTQLIERIVSIHDKLFKTTNTTAQELLSKEKLRLRELENPLKLEQLTKGKTAALALQKIALFKLVDKSYLSQLRGKYLNSIQLREEDIQLHIDQNNTLKEQLDILGNDVATSYERSVIIIKDLDNREKINTLRNQTADLKLKLAIFDLELKPKTSRLQAIIKAAQSEINLIGLSLTNKIKLQRQVVSGLEKQLSGRKTQTIAVDTLSLSPVGLTQNMRIVFTVFLSFITAFMITCIVVFRSKVNEKLAEKV